MLSAKYTAIAVLKDRRTEILKEIDRLGSNADARREDLVHIEACLKMFGATDDRPLSAGERTDG